MRTIATLVLVMTMGCQGEGAPPAPAPASSANSAAAASSTPPTPVSALVTSAAAPASSSMPLDPEASLKAFLKAAIAKKESVPEAERRLFQLVDVKAHDAASDPNKLLGRPGQYLQKATWKALGGDATVEFFATVEDARKRFDYTSKISSSSPMFLQYIYVNERHAAVLRLPKDLTPDQAKAWQALFEAL